ncbi:CHAD domain-containing protein [Pseudomonas sp. NPDC089569]|uniref:CHAD domain-containing protein n=1 Tax=Pseudomonas sp. NPDC089569 TaxID=3390722 RepID=UPI003D014330
MAFVDTFVAEIISLQVALYHARSRLEARTDPEALHDLRITVRRIRSLLRPFRAMHEVTALNEAAADVGRQTTPARDLEVLIEELQQRGFPELAQRRRARLNASYHAVVNGQPLKRLMAALDAWPAGFRAARSNGRLQHLEQKIRKTLNKQVDRLHAAIADTQFDRHQLRILVKRTRYLTEAFPQLAPLSGNEAKLLKSLQSALGSWHDHYLWSEQARVEKDLLPLMPVWSACAAAQLEKAEVQLAQVASLLPKPSGPLKGGRDLKYFALQQAV